ncbi:MAG: transcription elongation factor GreB [Deltaproteobacteria bacterium]|jgi:transcription elongation factor GreB
MAEKRPITPEGYERIQDEMRRLWHEDRPRIVQEVADAAAQGDRSENAEYIYGKKKLREIDRRMRYLTKVTKQVKVVDPKDNAADFVQFGATVDLEDEDGKTRCYTIVGEDEVDAKRGRISMKSPMGKALLGHRVGDDVVVVRPAGEIELVLTGLKYG